MANLSFGTGKAFDLAVAGLAASSAGFLVFAMPEDLFSSLVLATPLPDLLPAARPPLGDTARIAAVAAVAGLAFVAVALLLGLLDRLPRRRPAVVQTEAPRLRKADAHPDAPARRPLLAGRELGEPLDLAEPLPDGPAPSAEAPAEIAAEMPEPRPLPAFLVPEEAPALLAEEAPAEGERAPSEPTSAGPGSLAALAARLPDPAASPEASLADMVARVETGVSVKRQALARPPVEAPAADSGAEEEKRVGHRLRSAISELQKISQSA